MSKLTTWMDRFLYPHQSDNWDDSCFRDKILTYLERAWTILDLGAGAGIVPLMNFRGRVERVVGVDPDPRVRTNPHLDLGSIGLGDDLPFPDATFDLVFADNVLEHLSEPEIVFREIARTLKPGGYFLAKTPNRRHYVPLIARMTPHWFHEWVNMRRGRCREDSFPTLYKANSSAAIGRHASISGLAVEHIAFLEGRPEYLRKSTIPYLFGWIFERVVNSLPGLSQFRVVIIATLRKPMQAVTRDDSSLAA